MNVFPIDRQGSGTDSMRTIWNEKWISLTL